MIQKNFSTVDNLTLKNELALQYLSQTQIISYYPNKYLAQKNWNPTQE